MQEGLCGSSREAAPQAAAPLALQCEEDKHLLPGLGPKDWWLRARQNRYMHPGLSRFTFESTIGMADHNSFDKTPEILDEAAEGLRHGRRLGACRAAGLEGSKVPHGLDDPVSTRALGLCGGDREGGGKTPMIPSAHKPLACMEEKGRGGGAPMGCTEGSITPGSSSEGRHHYHYCHYRYCQLVLI